MNPWRCIPFERLSCFENMAIDEAILRNGRVHEGGPTLRFYGWVRPSVTLGYFQDMAKEVDLGFCRAQNIDVVRRPTGGKAVYHDADVTYSVVARERDEGFSSDIIETYRVISACLLKGLKKLGIEAALVEEGRTHLSSAGEAFCFSVPFKNELLVKGGKICGSAQMRSQGLFLQHGSILIDLDLQRVAQVMAGGAEMIESMRRSVTALNNHTDHPVSEGRLVEALRQAFEEEMGAPVREGALTAAECALKDSLLTGKYLTDRWNMKGKG